jgi:peptide deformylase
VKYQTFKGEEIRTTLSGYVSRVFQHEYDHMLGIDFTQRVSKMKLDRAIKKMKKDAKSGRTTQVIRGNFNQ